MSVYGRILLAVLGSAALLLGALGFQYLGELQPCPLCIWQRWPHVVAIVIGLATMTVLWRLRVFLAWMGALAMAVGVGLGFYHVGVEQTWWASDCSGIDPTKVGSDELLGKLTGSLDKLEDALKDPATTYVGEPLIPCDSVPWDLFGISMAGWNMILSAGLVVLWVFAALPKSANRYEAPG